MKSTPQFGPVKLMPVWLSVLILLPLFILPLPASGAEQAYLYDPADSSMLELNTLSALESYALDINDNAQVTGYWADMSGEAHAFFWQDDDSGMQDLGTLKADNSGLSIGRGINSAGVLVGESEIDGAGNYTHAFTYDTAGGMVDIHTLAAGDSYAYDINTAGQVVGYADVSGVKSGFLHDGSTMLTLLPLSGGNACYAYGINDSGVIVGYSNETAGSQVFYVVVWDAAAPANLPVKQGDIPVGQYRKRLRVDSTGRIGGHFLPDPAVPVSNGFFYDGALAAVPPLAGGTESLCFDINDAGLVVGHSTVPQPAGEMPDPRPFLPLRHGIVYDSSTGETTDFSAPFLGDWDRCFAYAINSSGQIVGGKTPNIPPDPPDILSPADGATDVSLTVLLQTSIFYDADADDPATPNDTHGRTQWQISTVSFSTPPAATDMVLDVTSTTRLTQLEIPAALLKENTTYYIRARYYDSRGARSDWSGDSADADSDFTFTTLTLGDDTAPDGGNGVPDDQDVDLLVDLDNNGTADISQADIRCVDTVVGEGQIGFKFAAPVTGIERMFSIDPAGITDAVNRPDVLPLGITACRLTVTAPGDAVSLTAYLSDAAPSQEWYKYDTINGWQDYSANVVFNSATEIVINLVDGGIGDADGVANGVIVDPSGFGFAASANPPHTPVLLTPANAAIDVATTPALTTDAFTDDDGDSHYRTRWQISTTSDFNGIVLDHLSETQLTGFTVPDYTLNAGATYYWRAQFFDNFYTASAWPAAFSFTTAGDSGADADGNGIPDTQDLDPVADVEVDMDANGAMDLNQSDIKVVHTVLDPFETGLIGVKPSTGVTGIDSMESIDTTSLSPPVEMPLGAISLKLSVAANGDTGEVTVYLSEPAPLAQWYFYTPADGWQAYPYATFSADRKTVTLQMIDGDYGDADGIANGAILITSGFGFPASNPPGTPSLTSPTDPATGVALTPTLTAGAFSDADTGDTHFRTQWQVATDETFSTPVLNIFSDTHLTAATLPQGVLEEDTTYYWRVRYFDNYYTPSAWPTRFSFTTVAADPADADQDGIPDTQELDPVADITVDMDADATADIGQTDIKVVHTAKGSGMIAVKASTNVTAIDTLTSVDDADITDTTGKPDTLPLGIVQYKITVTDSSLPAEVIVYLSDAAPVEAWYKYDSLKGWTDYTAHAVFSADRKSVTLTLKDGSIGDADGAVNTFVVDPSGFGYPASTAPTAPVPLSPAEAATDVELTPTLQTDVFSDPDGNNHFRTHWQIATDTGFTNLLLDAESEISLTTLDVPASIVPAGTLCYWRVRFTDDYFAVSDWSATASFTTVATDPDDANGDGIPDTQELQSPADDTVDVDSDGTYDLVQTDIRDVHTVAGGGIVGVKAASADITATNTVRSVDPSTITDTLNKPAYLPLGLTTASFAVTSGATVQAVFHHSSAPRSPYWFAYDGAGGWQDFSAYVTFSADLTAVTVTMRDGGFGDADGLVNGIIVHTGGFGEMSLPTTPDAPELLTPTDGAAEQPVTPILTTGAFSDPNGDTHYQTEWQISEASDFGTLTHTVTSETDLVSHTVPAGVLANGVLYYWRARYIDSQSEMSAWPQALTFTTTPNIIPDAPTLSAPLDGATDAGLTPTLQTAPFSDPNTGDTHTLTEWQVSTASDFNTLAFSSDSAIHLTSITLPDSVLADGTLYYWRARFTDSYTIPGVSDWPTPFSLTTATDTGDANENGIPDSQEVGAQVDMDGDSTADASQVDIKSFNTVIGGGAIGIKTGSGVTSIDTAKSIDPATITDTTGRPETMPLGLASFRVTTDTVGGAGVVSIYLSDPSPETVWFAYDPVNGWQDLTAQATYTGGTLVTLQLQDGGTGDADGIANGVIVHAGGFGFAASTAPNAPGIVAPLNLATDVSLTPTLETDAFTDPDLNGHYRTQWQISTASDFSANIILDISRTDHLTRLTVPALALDESTVYYWRARYTDTYYAASGWSATVSFTTLASAPPDDADLNGIPDLQELDAVVDMDVDLDNNGTSDIAQSDLKALRTVIGVFGDEMIAVKQTATISDISKIQSFDPANITDTSGRPDMMPLGLIGMQLAVAAAGDQGQVTVHHSEPAPLDAWYTYDSINGWQDMTAAATFGADRKTVTLTLVDGGYGDLDGTANSVILHTGAFGFAASPNAPDMPVISVPADAAIDIGLAPTLQTGAFSDSDTGDTHFKTHWQVSTTADFDSANMVLDRVSETHLTALPVPVYVLRPAIQYYWRVQYYDTYYTPSVWSDNVATAAAFTTVSTDPEDADGDGVPDTQESADGVDLDVNSVNDNVQTGMKSVATVVGGGNMSVALVSGATAIETLKSEDPAALPADGRPDQMPLGILSFRLAVPVGGTAEVTVYFSVENTAAQWYKYDSINGWQDYGNHAVFAADFLSVTLTLMDGGFGDADGIANGVIIDPSGMGIPKTGDSGTASPAPASPDSGGCFVNALFSLN